ncbi:MAG TPA: SDR family NAD(P)-dependent oxidoreductase [Kiritimatiellia bacterium]|nr:SDR family NAD(P)-dependent oxidoreductase [Kiritimatiellia bacterium]
MNTVILGATQGMGQALSRQMAVRGDALFLLGRDQSILDKCAQDLQARSNRPVAGTALCDLSDPSGFARALDRAIDVLGRIECVIVTAAAFHQQTDLESNPELTRKLLEINFTNTILFCEETRRRLLANGGGTLCVFSSVAGDRGRKPVILYGASKAGLSYYLEGLDHKFRSEGLKVVCVKPGFVRTGMTAGLKPPPFAGDPEDVARRVLAAITAGKPVVYAPPIWRLIMTVICCLPRAVMRRISF